MPTKNEHGNDPGPARITQLHNGHLPLPNRPALVIIWSADFLESATSVVPSPRCSACEQSRSSPTNSPHKPNNFPGRTR